MRVLRKLYFENALKLVPGLPRAAFPKIGLSLEHDPLLVALVLMCRHSARVRAEAQVRPVYDMGAAGLVQVLQRLQTTASVLHTGAHPDDEDSAFLARAARGDHARVAYLSLNRGEGGQNIIGTELFDALGVIRTEELLQARRLDGGEQFFTRTFDYGFSKRREEAAAKWDEREVLGDMVRVIRMFRPLVIYSRFGGTPADGHGHHQMAGYLTPLAFKAAADPNEFPEQLQEGLRPWQARKLYHADRWTRRRPRCRCRPASSIRRSAAPMPRLRSRAAASTSRRSRAGIETLGPLDLGASRASRASVHRPDSRSSRSSTASTSPCPGSRGSPAFRTERCAPSSRRSTARRRRRCRSISRSSRRGSCRRSSTGCTARARGAQALPSLNAPAGARADADFLLAFKERDFTTRSSAPPASSSIRWPTTRPWCRAAASASTFARSSRSRSVATRRLDGGRRRRRAGRVEQPPATASRQGGRWPSRSRRPRRRDTQ